MPVKRRAPKLRKTDWAGVTPDALAWLRGENALWEFADAPRDLDLDGFYAEHAERLVAEHVETQPGTRPRMWWRFLAPGPRRRLGGVGEIKRGFRERLEFGIPVPSLWATEALDPRYFGGGKMPVPLDPSDPPRFESQAALLKRRGLLLPGEGARLGAEAFAPEIVTRDGN